MRRGLRVLVAATTVSAVMAAPVAAVAAAPSDLQRQLDTVVADGGVGALAEVRDGHRVWRGTSGVAEFGTTRKVPVRGQFRAGSITKTFVATVVLQLVDEDELRLDDPVETYLPGVVPNGENIKLRYLLNHTSTLFDFMDTLTMQEILDGRWRTWTAEEMVSRALAKPPTSKEPGKVFDYSNTNYTLLGMIIEKVTGASYADEIKRRVILPLGLRGTELPGTSPWIRRPHPHGYIPSDEGLVDYTEMNPSIFGAGGELISTASDLNHFFAVLLDGGLLPPNLLAEMKTPGTKDKNYGLGLAWRDTSCGTRVYGNDGDSLTYQSWSFSTEDTHHQATVVLTPNHTGDPDETITTFLNTAFCD